MKKKDFKTLIDTTTQNIFNNYDKMYFIPWSGVIYSHEFKLTWVYPGPDGILVISHMCRYGILPGTKHS